MSDSDQKNKPNKRKTILIFGISSFVGSNLAEFFKKDYRVVGTYHKTPVKIPGVLSIRCDALVKEEVQLAFYAFKPDIAIYCGGLSSLIECHKKEGLADALNTSGVFNIVEYCQRYKAQVCYISSSYVFSGEEASYLEMDIPDPNCIYGKTQAAAEFFIQKTSLNYLIFRCSKLYGRGVNPTNPTWFENLQRFLKMGKTISLDGSIETGYLDVYYLAMIMRMSFDKGVMNRLFQVSSSNQLSLYDFSQSYCKVFNDSHDLISKTKWTFPSTTTSVGDRLTLKLETSNIEGFLNIELPSVEDSLKFTFQRLNGVEAKTGRMNSGEEIRFI